MEGVLSILTNTNNFEEDRIVKKAIRGDKEAFVEIFTKHKISLYKTAYMYVKNEEKALEILQETITRGVFNINKLKNPKYFKTWITRILLNVAIDMNKKTSRVEELTEANEVIQNTDKISLEEKMDLYNAVDLLRDKYKTVIIMMYFNDMKMSQISEVMGILENTVKTYHSRAKVELKRILREGYLNE